MVMRNVVRRVILADVDTVGAELDRIERHWPAPPWPALHLDRGLTAGSPGRHGRIRYHVESHQPGRRTRWVFTPDMGLTGYNEIRVLESGPGRAVITDELAGRLRGRMVLVWPLGLRWLHEALINDLFDNIERAATGTLRGSGTLDDRHSIRRPPDTPADPEVWARAIFRTRPLGSPHCSACATSPCGRSGSHRPRGTRSTRSASRATRWCSARTISTWTSGRPLWSTTPR